jgi:hypothetical protein
MLAGAEPPRDAGTYSNQIGAMSAARSVVRL